MDNLSFIKGIGMPADIALNTRSPQLGEKPSDHFKGMKGVSSLPEGEEGVIDEIMELLDGVLGDLTEDDLSSLEDWVKGLFETDGSQELHDDGAIGKLLGDILDKLVAKIDESGSQIRIPENTKELFTNDLRQFAVLQGGVSDGSLSKEDIRPKESPAGQLIKNFIEGHRKIASHYGSPRQYGFGDIIAASSSLSSQPLPSEAVIAPLHIIGSGMAEYFSEHYRDYSQSSGGRLDLPESMAGKQDMVLDKKMAQTIINKAMESLNADNQKIKENEFTLKIYPRSLGEINVSVTSSRDQINIAIEASQEAADKIKNDIIYFSNHYDNMEWRLNDNQVGGQSSGSEGLYEGEDTEYPLIDKSSSHPGIINIII